MSILSFFFVFYRMVFSPLLLCVLFLSLGFLLLFWLQSCLCSCSVFGLIFSFAGTNAMAELILLVVAPPFFFLSVNLCFFTLYFCSVCFSFGFLLVFSTFVPPSNSGFSSPFYREASPSTSPVFAGLCYGIHHQDHG